MALGGAAVVWVYVGGEGGGKRNGEGKGPGKEGGRGSIN